MEYLTQHILIKLRRLKQTIDHKVNIVIDSISLEILFTKT